MQRLLPASQRPVMLYGAKTLDRFTVGILQKGLAASGRAVQLARPDQIPDESSIALFQVHGADQSRIDDAAIIETIKRTSALSATLVHRPDELQDSLLAQSFTDAMHAINQNNGAITHLGSWHINDDFYRIVGIRHVVPHTFFQLDPILQTAPVIIGTDTTWDDKMRSTEHLLMLLAQVFDSPIRGQIKMPVIGYFSGKPAEQVSLELLQQKAAKYASQTKFVFVPASEMTVVAAGVRSGRGENIVLFGNKAIPVTFNTQMYFRIRPDGQRVIRTGESSGSAHITTGIPTVWEMNNAQLHEELSIVQIPHPNMTDLEAVDYKTGAELILGHVQDGSYWTMLQTNFDRSKQYTPLYAASLYNDLFSTVAAARGEE
jgi:hypothetical protein